MVKPSRQRSLGLSGLYGGGSTQEMAALLQHSGQDSDGNDEEEDEEEGSSRGLSSAVPLLGAAPAASDSHRARTKDTPPGSHGGAGARVDANALFRKLNWRLLPLFWCMVVLNYIDRTNLAFAAIQLNQDLGFPPHVYGLGSGLFFTTYATLQIPSNILLRRFGGPGWLSAIIAAWGAIAVSFAFMRTQGQFFLLRALLGVAEAGAFPGMWYMLNRFYPPSRITLAFAVVESGIPLSHTLAGPLAAALLSLDGLRGLKGWQWLFILEGLPSVLLAAAMLRLLPASPETAPFLSPEERQDLAERVELAQQPASPLPSPISGHAHDPPPPAVAPKSAAALGASGPSAPSLLNKAAGVASLAPAGGAPAGIAATAGGGSCAAAAATERLLPGVGAVTGGRGGAGATAAAVAAGRARWPWRLLPEDVRVSLAAAARNKHVWYLGLVKFLRDIAGFGIVFFAPMIVQALIKGEAVPMHAALKPVHVSPAGRGSAPPRPPPLRAPGTGGGAGAAKAPAGGSTSSNARGRTLLDGLVDGLRMSAHSGAAAGSAEHGGGRLAGGSGLLGEAAAVMSAAAAASLDGGGERGEKGGEGWATAGRALLGGAVPVGGVGEGGKGQVGVRAALLTSIPFGLTAAATMLVAHRSQVTNERVMHVGVPALVGGLVFALFPFLASRSSVAGFACLCVGVVGVSCASAPCLALVSELAAGPGLVVALPLYNSLGNVGGFLGPYLIGLMLASTQNSFALPTVMMGLCLASAGLLVLLLPALLGLPPGVAGVRHHRK